MIPFLFSTVCAIALNVAPEVFQADTSNVYIIDNQEIKNFDGSQLQGKTIVWYNIAVAKDRPVKIHLIKTDKSSGTGLHEYKDMAVFIDGKEVSADELKSVNSSAIASIEILKAGSVQASKYAGGKQKDVVLVSLKSDQEGDRPQSDNVVILDSDSKDVKGNKDGAQDDTVYILDGKPITLKQLKKMNPDDIKEMTVSLNNAKESAKYKLGDNIKKIIVITTK